MGEWIAIINGGICDVFLEDDCQVAWPMVLRYFTLSQIIRRKICRLLQHTRATEGPIVCDKNCEKIHYMAPNIYCCGAGTAADTEAVTGTSMIEFN